LEKEEKMKEIYASKIEDTINEKIQEMRKEVEKSIKDINLEERLAALERAVRTLERSFRELDESVREEPTPSLELWKRIESLASDVNEIKSEVLRKEVVGIEPVKESLAKMNRRLELLETSYNEMKVDLEELREKEVISVMPELEKDDVKKMIDERVEKISEELKKEMIVVIDEMKKTVDAERDLMEQIKSLRETVYEMKDELETIKKSISGEY
jgi:uncharacterized protein YoxC